MLDLTFLLYGSWNRPAAQWPVCEHARMIDTILSLNPCGGRVMLDHNNNQGS